MIYIIFVISITFHEIGHVVMSKALKVQIDKPKFNFWGYSSKINNDRFSYKILVLIFGPLANFLVATIICYVNIDYDLKILIFYMNLFLGIINLFPILPLDGGNILKLILEQKLGFEKSTRVCLILSKILLIIITLLYSLTIFFIKNIWIFVSLIYLWFIYIKEENKFELYMKIKQHYKKCIM